MALYRDTNNKIHDDMDGMAAHLLPPGCILLGPQQAAQIQADIKAASDAAVLGQENFKALIRRRADALGNAGQHWEAIKLLKTIGE